SECPISQPLAFKPSFKYFALSHNLSCNSVEAINFLTDSVIALVSPGAKEVENKKGLEATFNQSIKSFVPATYPPTTPIALDNVPIWKSILSCKPKCFTVPAPLPITPEP